MGEGIVIIPAFNEALGIGGLVTRLGLTAPDFDVLVVDDASEDSTAKVAAEKGARVVSHPLRMGYGVALQTGYRYAVRKGYKVLVQLDGDGQHDPVDVTKLAGPVIAGEADAVYGSRFHPDSTYRMSALRRLGSRWFALLVRLITGRAIADPTTGYQALSRDVLKLYATDAFPFDYPDADMIVLLHRCGFRLCEVAVHMEEKPESPSMHSGLRVIYYVYKMTLAILMNAIRSVDGRGR